jgi:hypothetical protein
LEGIVADPLTQKLAIWGAVTGTIGTLAGLANLYLRFKHQREDRANLVCSPDLQYEDFLKEPTPRFRIIARSKGRRPITVDFVRYYLRPDSQWKSLLSPWHWKQGQWKYDQEERLHKITLTEGRKASIRIEIPGNPPLITVAKVSIFDEVGREWKVPWPKASIRRRLDLNEKLDELSSENEGRWYTLLGQIVGGEYRITVRWHKARGNNDDCHCRQFRFSSYRKYKLKMKALVDDELPKVLAGKLGMLS